MTTLLIVTGIIVWCVVGYFVNIYAGKIGDWAQGYYTDTCHNDVLMSIVFSFIFPVTSIIIICISLYNFNREIPLFKKLADWHNGDKHE